MKSLMKFIGFKSTATLAVMVISQMGAYAATGSTTQDGSISAVGVIGGVALLIAAIVLPTFKRSKVVAHK